MPEIFQYSFIIRGLEAGIVVALIAPLIGIFLVLRRYSLIADTLSHVSLAGVAIGFLLDINPVFTAIAAATISSVVIERLRSTRRVYGESALAIFLSGSLAVAVVILGLAHGFNANLFNYLFGSIVTVTQTDVLTIILLGAVVIISVLLFYKELIFISFDEEAAKVSGIPTQFINTILIVLSALAISLAIPIVGVLLISALIVIPVASALQLHLSFLRTLITAEIFSVLSVISGVVASYYLDLATGGTIVIFTLMIFLTILLFQRK